MSSSLVFISGASSGIGLALAQGIPWTDARILNISRRKAQGCENFLADLADPVGVYDLADLQTFVQGFLAGCP